MSDALRPQQPQYELKAQVGLDPRTILLMWGAASIAVGVTVSYLLVHGQIREILLLLLTLLGVGCLAPRRGVYILIVFLPFMYYIRRLVLNFQEFDRRDPILLFPALTAVAMFLGAAIFYRSTILRCLRLSPLLKTVLALLALFLFQVVNPLQESILVGVAGGLYFLIPMTWTLFGVLLKKEDMRRILTVVLVIGGITALYGLYQHYFGLTAAETYELRSKSFLKYIGAEGNVRIMSTFASLGDFSLYMAVSGFIAFASFWRTKKNFLMLVLLGLMVFAMVWTAVRTSFMMLIFSCLILLVAYGSNVSRIFVRGLMALVCVIGIYAAFSLSNPEKLYAGEDNPYVTHTLSGMTHATREASFQKRLSTWAGVVRSTMMWPNFLGRGLGSTTTAAIKFGSGGIAIDSFFFELFYGSGLLAPAVFLILVWLCLASLLRLCLLEPDNYEYKVVLGLLCGLFLTSVFGLAVRDTITGPLAWLMIGWTARQAAEARQGPALKPV